MTDQRIACLRMDTVKTFQNDMVVEIKSPAILSPGPAAITEGLRPISALIAQFQERRLST